MTDSQTIDLTSFDDESIDFTNVTTSRPVREAGTYAATITDVKPQRARTGNMMLVAEFSFTDPNAKGKVWNNYVITPNSLWRLKGDAIKIGCDPAVFEGQVNMSTIIEELKNRPVAVTIGVEDYTNNDGDPAQRNNIVRVDGPEYLDEAPAKGKKKGGF